MEQLDFGEKDRYVRLDDKKDPLVKLNAIIPWELFRPRLRSVWREPERVPDARTVWLYRNKLAQAGVIEELFADFDGHLNKRGYKAMGGQIIDASIVSVPKQRNTRDENEKIKKGETPEGWKKQKRAQKDTEARWTKKHGISYYKNHVNVDVDHKLIRGYGVTGASVHDSQVFEEIPDEDNSGEGVWADSAYRSKEMEKVLKERGYRSHVHRKGSRNRPLGRWAKYDNSIYSVVRAEHVFGSQSNDMGGRLLRSIGVVRAGAHIGLKNLVYNMRRLVYLEGAARGV